MKECSLHLRFNLFNALDEKHTCHSCTEKKVCEKSSFADFTMEYFNKTEEMKVAV